jgi:hypothetical protein
MLLKEEINFHQLRKQIQIDSELSLHTYITQKRPLTAYMQESDTITLEYSSVSISKLRAAGGGSFFCAYTGYSKGGCCRVESAGGSWVTKRRKLSLRRSLD